MDQIRPVGPTLASLIVTHVLRKFSKYFCFIQYVKWVHWDGVQLTPMFPFDVPSIFGFNIGIKTQSCTQKHTTACHIKERRKIIKISKLGFQSADRAAAPHNLRQGVSCREYSGGLNIRCALNLFHKSNRNDFE